QDVETIYEKDPFAPVQPLAKRQLAIPVDDGVPRPSPSGMTAQRPRRGEAAAGVIHTALRVEPRHGRLHVFMPPVRTTEDYLDLIATIERTAATLGIPVIVEGTPPEPDPRLNYFKVTPDPGVIEVNLHPAHSWAE